jgi:hypothetical protein
VAALPIGGLCAGPPRSFPMARPGRPPAVEPVEARTTSTGAASRPPEARPRSSARVRLAVDGRRTCSSGSVGPSVAPRAPGRDICSGLPGSSSSVSRYPFKRGRAPKVGRPPAALSARVPRFRPIVDLKNQPSPISCVRADGDSSGGTFGKASGAAAWTQRPSCFLSRAHAQVRATPADHAGYRPKSGLPAGRPPRKPRTSISRSSSR